MKDRYLLVTPPLQSITTEVLNGFMKQLSKVQSPDYIRYILTPMMTMISLVIMQQ